MPNLQKKLNTETMLWVAAAIATLSKRNTITERALLSFVELWCKREGIEVGSIDLLILLNKARELEENG